MGLPIFDEKRFHPRSKLTGLLPGKLINAATGEDLGGGRLVDLSATGLGLILSKRLEVDSIIKLIRENDEILFKVNWAQPDFGKRDLFRHGLGLMEEKIDLLNIFREAGCLSD